MDAHDDTLSHDIAPEQLNDNLTQPENAMNNEPEDPIQSSGVMQHSAPRPPGSVMEAAEQEQSQQEPRGVLHMDRPQLEHADTFYKRLWKHQRHNQSSHLSTSRMPLDGARQTKAAPTQTRRLSMTEPHRSLGQHQSDSSRRYAMCRAEPHPAEETTDTAGHNPHHGSHM